MTSSNIVTMNGLSVGLLMYIIYGNLLTINVRILLTKLYLFNYTSCFIVINIVGLYLFLKKVSFELKINWSIKYPHVAGP